MNGPSSPTLRHLEQLIADLTAGIILVDPSGVLIGANAAALRMHGVGALAELGTTAYDYCQRFCLRHRNHHRLKTREYPIMRMLAGESFPDVVVEVAPIGTNEPRWTHEVHDVGWTRMGSILIASRSSSKMYRSATTRTRASRRCSRPIPRQR